MNFFRSLFMFTSEEVSAAFTQAKPYATTSGLKILQSTDQNTRGKFLIITPRACGKAHQRNKLRRQIKAIIYQEKLYEQPKTWIILVRKQANDLSFDQIKDFLTKKMMPHEKNA